MLCKVCLPGGGGGWGEKQNQNILEIRISGTEVIVHEQEAFLEMQSGIRYCDINQSEGCSIPENFLTNKTSVNSLYFPMAFLNSPWHHYTEKAPRLTHTNYTLNYTDQTQSLPSNIMTM